ncbi:hypothetical protein HQ533_01910 [Candidatus Woesearchaeota archaeon]|nr:hypothetical protein [Candidatus Woesearchaeota archaeon]
MLEKLQRLGLTEKESLIYLGLVRQGESTANQVAKQTSTNRTVTYNILQQLIEKDLITYIKKGGKRYYSIANPESLLYRVREQEHLAQELVQEIKKVRVEPSSYKNVEVLEGKEGVKVIHEEIRKAKGLRILNATGLIFQHLKYGARHLVKEIELESNAKIIANQSMKKTPLVKYQFERKYLPKEAENYATTFIFNNKVIIQVLKDKPFMIIIENKEVYDGYKKDFDVLWEKL